jgi:hypothetical protein
LRVTPRRQRSSNWVKPVDVIAAISDCRNL